MYPELIHLGPLTIHTYGALYALGILTAVALSEYLYRRDGGKPETIMDLALPVVIGTLMGARALFIIVEHKYYLQNPAEIIMVWKGGLVFYGGLMGGALAFIITARVKKLDLWHLADTVAPGVALGHALGRLGCFFAGSCYGRPTDVPWAVIYSDPNSLARDIIGVPVHPTQLYSAAFLIFLSVILIFIGIRSTFKGQVIATYGILYGTFRFFIEFLRGDPRGTVALADVTLFTSQAVSLVLAPISIAAYIYLRREGASHD
ncbi:MAG: prolipoprotein diacylglyceryl transferase [bacterium]|nr:prolipoprotein diacylglyceryl transferase [bacterium]MDT8365504.1 prolipoprotein diacylglyceryl transferase [bacterium]